MASSVSTEIKDSQVPNVRDDEKKGVKGNSLAVFESMRGYNLVDLGLEIIIDGLVSVSMIQRGKS